MTGYPEVIGIFAVSESPARRPEPPRPLRTPARSSRDGRAAENPRLFPQERDAQTAEEEGYRRGRGAQPVIGAQNREGSLINGAPAQEW